MMLMLIYCTHLSGLEVVRAMLVVLRHRSNIACVRAEMPSTGTRLHRHKQVHSPRRDRPSAYIEVAGAQPVVTVTYETHRLAESLSRNSTLVKVIAYAGLT